MKNIQSGPLAFVKKHWLLILVALLLIWILVKEEGPITLNQKSVSGENFYAMDMMEESSITPSAAPVMSDSRSVSALGGGMEGDGMDAALATDQKVIKTGSLGLHVEDVQSSVEDITSLVEQWQGVVLNTNVTRGEDSYWGYMTVRVPADQFDAAFLGLKDLAIYVDSEYTNADDVTETYLDLQARLKNLQAEEESYLKLLNDETGSLEEVLQVTQALSTVRYRIESAQTQINYYDARTDYSSISISLTEDSSVATASGKWRPIATIRQSFSEWVFFLQDAADWVIRAVVFGWPILLLLILIWLVRRKK